MDPFIGEIKLFAGNFSPENWAFCNGALLPVYSNPELYAIIGNTYGGSGEISFALPNLAGVANTDMAGVAVNYIIALKGEFPTHP